MSDNKRPATAEETRRFLYATRDRWDLMNPGHEQGIEFWKEKQEQAEKEGYKSEVCGECGGVFLAFHHFTACRSETCPMKDGTGKSVLDHLQESIEETAP